MATDVTVCEAAAPRPPAAGSGRPPGTAPREGPGIERCLRFRNDRGWEHVIARPAAHPRGDWEGDSGGETLGVSGCNVHLNTTLHQVMHTMHRLLARRPRPL